MSKQVVLLKSHPKGEPVVDDFEQVEQPLEELADGLIRLEPVYFSVDPYLRGNYNYFQALSIINLTHAIARMTGKTDSYFVPFALGGPVTSLGVGKVVASKDS